MEEGVAERLSAKGTGVWPPFAQFKLRMLGSGWYVTVEYSALLCPSADENVIMCLDACFRASDCLLRCGVPRRPKRGGSPPPRVPSYHTWSRSESVNGFRVRRLT